MKVLTIESLRTFLEEIERRYGKETYSKQEIDEKLKSSGGSVDLKELADRIPNFKYWLRIRQSPNQTITATVDGKEYTADVLIEKGKTVTVTVKADVGYIAGTLSETELVMAEDTEITVTEAKKAEGEVAEGEVKAGSVSFPPEYFENRNDFELEVPTGVNVLKLDTHLRSNEDYNVFREPIYFKVVPGTKLKWTGALSKGNPIRVITSANHISFEPPINVSNRRYGDDREFTFSWSKEINSHATDIDLTELGNKWIIKNYKTKLLVPDRFSVLKVEMGGEVKYVKLGKKRELNVELERYLGIIDIENKRIFYLDRIIDDGCTVSWSDEIDKHAWDIELSVSN